MESCSAGLSISTQQKPRRLELTRPSMGKKPVLQADNEACRFPRVRSRIESISGGGSHQGRETLRCALAVVR
jgi:hypothetical protein